MTIGASSGRSRRIDRPGHLRKPDPVHIQPGCADPRGLVLHQLLQHHRRRHNSDGTLRCGIRWGTTAGLINAYQASPTLRNVTVQNSKTYGAYLYTSEPTIEDCTFSGNQNYDLYYTGTVGGTLTGSTINSGIYLLATGTVSFSGNTINQNNAFPIKAYADNVGPISASTFNNVDASSYLEVSVRHNRQ